MGSHQRRSRHLNRFSETFKKLTESWKKAQRSQQILIIAVIALTVVAISVVVSMNSQVQYTVLYSGMDPATAGAIQTYLEDESVDVQAKGDGTLLVPADQANALRYELGAQGLLPTTDIDYSLYQDNASSFSATDADKALYAQYQLQVNLARTINKMEKIDASTVMLSLADTSQFVLSENNNRESTASVMVEVAAGQTLTDADVNSIREIVSGAVKSLPMENIRVVDQYMNSYGGSGDANSVEVTDEHYKLQQSVGEQLGSQIVNLLAPVFGREKLSTNVNVILDFDKYSSESITLEPPGDADNMGIIVSLKTMEERILGGTVAEGEPGLDTNGGAPVYQEVEGMNADDVYYQVTQELNAEVNQLIENLERAQGSIKDISATLVIDGGDEISDLLPEIRTMISTAVGIPEDKITVSNMAFEENIRLQELADEQAQAIAEQERNDLIRTLIIPIAIIAGILVVVLLILNSVKRNKQMELEQQRLQWEAEQAALQAEQGGGIDLVADEEISVEDLMKSESDSTLKQLQSLISGNPEVIAQVLRNWLLDDGR